MSTGLSTVHYNPGWLSDDALVANFVARQDDFSFLREELVRAPLKGSVQHYLLVGLRGSGKTTLLRRIAVAIRNDADIQNHLIALSFPEELYDVKNLADFWWAACIALVDELDRLGETDKADQLIRTVEHNKRLESDADSLADSGLNLLLKVSAELGRRPVLLVDNLDQVFQRIDKSGRKLKDPHAPAYWALREALSTTTSPIVIGGSVRLSEPFTDYDKAFYDFFLPKRLGKLAIDEVRDVLDRLADSQNAPSVKERLRVRPSRIDALYQLTGGNPRAVGLIFELLRQGPNGRAVEDFERLMDITTPYYKARFEDLAEQAQVVMHALAVRRPGNNDGLRFGHTAAEIGTHTGLPTRTVSAQMDVLEREGLTEKSASHGRTQYRIAEQLFRLWLQMRSSRRIRQNVIGLSEFLEAMYDRDELLSNMRSHNSSNALSEAQLSFAVAGTQHCEDHWRRGLEAHGADRLLQHLQDQGGKIDDYLPSGDLPEDLGLVVKMRRQLLQCMGGGLSAAEQDALLGTLELRIEQRQAYVNALCTAGTTHEDAIRLRQIFAVERQRLLRYGLKDNDLPLLFGKRARGFLPLPMLTPLDVEAALTAKDDHTSLRSMAWRLVGARKWVKFSDSKCADEWLAWGLKFTTQASATEWANVADSMRRSRCFSTAKKVLDHASNLGTPSRVWFEQGALIADTNGDYREAESAFRKAIELDPQDAFPWNALGCLLCRKPDLLVEAEAAFQTAIELDPAYTAPWINLGNLLNYTLNRSEEAETAYRNAIGLNPTYATSWCNLGNLLSYKLNRIEEAEASYHKAIALDPAYASPWSNLGNLLNYRFNRPDEAEAAYRKAIELKPANALPWNGLGNLLHYKLDRFDEAEAAYRKAIEFDPAYAQAWNNLGHLLQYKLGRFDEAKSAYRQALELGPTSALPWFRLGNLLHYKLDRLDEAEAAYRKAIELDPAYVHAWSNLGNLLHYKLDRLDEAEAAYRKAIELDPAYAQAWSNLGNLLHYKLDRLDEAEAAYRKAIELDPAYVNAWGNLGNLLHYKLDRLDEAEAAYRKSIELDGTYSLAWSNLGNLLLYKFDRLDEAESAYRKAIELDPAYAQAWGNLGNLLHYKLDQSDEAESAYRKAIELDPAYVQAWGNLGNLLHYKLDQFDEAESAYRKAIELDPAYVPAWSNLGDLLDHKLNRLSEAEMAYRKVIEIDPRDFSAWQRLAYLLGEEQNRYDEAVVACRCAIGLNPDHSGTWNNLGFLLGEKLNRPEEAEAAYRKAIELEPEFSWAWNNLGLLFDAQDRLDEAANAYSRGASLPPETYLYWGKRRAELQTRRHANLIRQALDSDNGPGLRDALGRLLTESSDIAAAIVSEHFVEGVLTSVLDNVQRATTLLALLRDIGYEKYARPLLLALEAAIENRSDKLAEIEPEIQSAAQRMFERLTARRR